MGSGHPVCNVVCVDIAIGSYSHMFPSNEMCMSSNWLWLLTAPLALGVCATISPCGCWPRPPSVFSPRPLLPPGPRPLRPRCACDSNARYSELFGSNAGSATVFQLSSPPSSSYARLDIFLVLSLLDSASCSRIVGCADHGFLDSCLGRGVP